MSDPAPARRTSTLDVACFRSNPDPTHDEAGIRTTVLPAVAHDAPGRPYADWIRACRVWASCIDGVDPIIDCSTGAPLPLMIKLGMLLADKDVSVIGRSSTLLAPLHSARFKSDGAGGVVSRFGYSHPFAATPGLSGVAVLFVTHNANHRLGIDQMLDMAKIIDPSHGVALVIRCCLAQPDVYDGELPLTADNIASATACLQRDVDRAVAMYHGCEQAVGLCVVTALPAALNLAVGTRLRSQVVDKPVHVFDRVGSKYELAFSSGV